MTRVAHLIQCVDDRSGGTSTAFLQLMGAVAMQPGLEPHAYTLRPPEADSASLEVAANPDRWHLADSLGRFGKGHLGELVTADLAAGRIDVLHLHGVWSPDLVAAAGAARRAGVPYCWQPHGMLLEHALAQKSLKKRLFLRLGLARALSEASAFVFCTAGERDGSILPSGSNRDARHIVFLPVTVPAEEADIPRYRAEGRAKFGFPDGAPVVVFVGRIHPVKRLELTLRAFAHAAPSLSPAARLALFGSGDERYIRSLRDLAASLGIAGRTQFPGWIAGDDKWRALAAADVLVLNSLHENFGYTVPEALGVRTPVVMTDNLSLTPDVVAASGGTSATPFVRTAPSEPQGLAAAIAAISAAPPSPEARAHARRWVLTTFSSAAIGTALDRLYRSLPTPAQGGSAAAATEAARA